jgi:signal peptidase I
MHDGYRAGAVPGSPDDHAPHDEYVGEAQETTDTLPVRSNEDDRSRGTLWEVVETLILALLIFVAVRSVVLNFRVDGLSMEPTLDSGEMLLVNRPVYFHFDANELINWLPFVDRTGEHIVYPFHPPQRGDIVVLHPPVDQGKPYIKRVIGLPGERLAIHDGGVYINGQRLNEPYLNGVSTTWAGSFGIQEIVIPEGDVFVMGDNRNNSSDSRAFGPISIDKIIGRAWIAYWPADDVGILRTPDYAH